MSTQLLNGLKELSCSSERSEGRMSGMFWLLSEVVMVRGGMRQVAVSKKRGFLQMLARRILLLL